MNELIKVAAEMPVPAIAGATVYLLLATRRIESRVEEIATHAGLAPRKRKSRGGFVILAVLLVAMLAVGCAYRQTCTAPGVCNTSVDVSTNALQVLPYLLK